MDTKHIQQWAAQHARHGVKAFGYSVEGLKAVFATETAFKQECAALILLPILGWLLGLPTSVLALIIGAWLALMAVELLNSALESLCNLVSQEFHPLIKKAKDAGSAAVLLMLCGNFLLWVYLLGVH